MLRILISLQKNRIYLIIEYLKLKKNIIASDKHLKPCIEWTYVKNLPFPPKPSFIQFFIIYVFWNNYSKTTFLKERKIIGREMKLIFDKWNLEKIKKIKN